MPTVRTVSLTQEWSDLRAWLESADGAWFVDDAVLGTAPLYAAEELLADYGIDPGDRANLRLLGRLVDEVINDGR